MNLFKISMLFPESECCCSLDSKSFSNIFNSEGSKLIGPQVATSRGSLMIADFG